MRKIVAAVDPRPEDLIVEVGAGRGVLTARLAAGAGRVVAVEKDERLVPGLEKRDARQRRGRPRRHPEARPRRDRRRGPALRLSVLSATSPTRSPLPFSSECSMSRRFFPTASFLLQKEVAERVTAGPGTKAYAPLGILLQNEFEARVAFTVAPGSFSPPPKVQSALLTLRRRPVPLHPGAADEPYRAFLRAAFAERRKMLWKNLSRRATPAALDAVYATLGLGRNVRAEELPPDQLFALYRGLCS
ncbi:MAG: hypothetical protein MZV64_49825 [Ignavibacteriales bacterium]|nr:hypothetical protein [Ignavibacteriales bacterium]